MPENATGNVPPRMDSRELASRFTERARRYLERENYPAAIEAYRNALTLAPERLELYFELGNAYSAVGEHANAIVMYEAVVEQRPTWAEAFYNLGNAFLQTEQLEKAAEAYQKAIALKEDFAEAHDNLGCVYNRLGDYAKAVACHETALRLRPSAATYDNLGYAFYKMNALDKAEEAHRQALTANADDAIAHYNLGLVYAARGEEEKALDAFASAFSRDPKLRRFAITDEDTQALRQNEKFLALLSG